MHMTNFSVTPLQARALYRFLAPRTGSMDQLVNELGFEDAARVQQIFHHTARRVPDAIVLDTGDETPETVD